MPGECWNCGRWLSGCELLEGYCWECKEPVNSKDGSYPSDSGECNIETDPDRNEDDSDE